MPGLVPGIHVLHHPRVLGGYVYILASAPNGILYIGVTNDIVRRTYEHRNGLVAGFTKNITRRFSDPARAQHEALVAKVESKIDTGRQSRMERSLRDDRLKRSPPRTWMAGTSPAMTNALYGSSCLKFCLIPDY
jgi:hypothetical protein